MVLSGGSSAGGHGVDRFYNPPAIRCQLLQEKRQHSLQRPAKARQLSPAASLAESDDSSSKTSVSSSTLSSPSPRLEPPAGNLERFLQSTTPFVPAQYFPKVKLGLLVQRCSLSLFSASFFAKLEGWMVADEHKGVEELRCGGAGPVF